MQLMRPRWLAVLTAGDWPGWADPAAQLEPGRQQHQFPGQGSDWLCHQPSPPAAQWEPAVITGGPGLLHITAHSGCEQELPHEPRGEVDNRVLGYGSRNAWELVPKQSFMTDHFCCHRCGV